MGRRIPLVLMAIALLAALTTAATFAWLSNTEGTPMGLPAPLVSADSAEGLARLARSEAMADHVALTASYRPQEKRSWCGVASTAMALTALGVPTTQTGVFTPEAEAVRSKLWVTLDGMDLDTLAGIIRSHGMTSVVIHGDDVRLRAAILGNLRTAGDVVIANYDRAAVGQEGSGHISPIAAWDRVTGSYLILDTASYRYPAAWIPEEQLFAALRSPDPSTGSSRGVVLVRPRDATNRRPAP